MILVDSSVWIEFFRKRPSSVHLPMDHFLEEKPPQISVCGIVAQEVLQGVKTQDDFQWVKSRLLMIPWLEITQKTYLSSAHLYRALRRKGVAATSVDALIAACALEHNAALWTLDRGFEPVAHSVSLRLYRWEEG